MSERAFGSFVWQDPSWGLGVPHCPSDSDPQVSGQSIWLLARRMVEDGSRTISSKDPRNNGTVYPILPEVFKQRNDSTSPYERGSKVFLEHSQFPLAMGYISFDNTLVLAAAFVTLGFLRILVDYRSALTSIGYVCYYPSDRWNVLSMS